MKIEREILIASTGVTTESFYRAIHSSHGWVGMADGYFDGTPNERSSGSSLKVDEAEERLGVKLPPKLRELYEHQNGGYVHTVCVPKPGLADHMSYSDVTMPFYEALLPTEELVTAHDFFASLRHYESM